MASTKDMVSLKQRKAMKEHNDNPGLKAAEMVRRNSSNDDKTLQHDREKEIVTITKLGDVGTCVENASRIFTKGVESNELVPMQAHVQAKLAQTDYRLGLKNRLYFFILCHPNYCSS